MFISTLQAKEILVSNFSASNMAMKYSSCKKKALLATIFLPLGGRTTGFTGLTGRRPNKETNRCMIYFQIDKFKFVWLPT